MSDVIEIDYTTEPPTITERSFTEAELAQREADRIAFEKAEEARKAEEALRNAKRAALLDRLGLTEDEATVLFS